MDYILQTSQIVKKYNNFTALTGLNMNVPRGSIYGFVGRNGAGKTTLIRIITGLNNPTSGTFTLMEQAILTQLSGRLGEKWARLLKRPRSTLK